MERSPRTRHRVCFCLGRRLCDVVVDRLYRPVGIVSSTDILAGIARAAE
ncbi:MAG: hypothetical protein ACYC3I_27855 [Gemmataceae bacterium]